jgi:hypothetical protein
LLGAASAVVFGLVSLTAASAQPLDGFSGMLQGDYANINSSRGGPDANVYGVSGSGLFPLGWSGLNFQGDVGYHDYVTSGQNVDNFNFAGDLFWRMPQGLVGGTVGYDTLNHPDTDITHYGGFGEYYTGPITFAAKGGGFSGDDHGYYLGGKVQGYATPDFALSGSVDYYKFNRFSNFHETDYTAQGEWLVSETMPVSVIGGYTYSDLPAGHTSTVFAGLRFYINPVQGDTLVDRQRNGSLDWSKSFSPTDIAF